MAALQVLVVGLVIYQWPFAPQYRTGGYDMLLVGVALVMGGLALALLFGGFSALVRELRNRWRFHR